MEPTENWNEYRIGRVGGAFPDIPAMERDNPPRIGACGHYIDTYNASWPCFWYMAIITPSGHNPVESPSVQKIMRLTTGIIAVQWKEKRERRSLPLCTCPPPLTRLIIPPVYLPLIKTSSRPKARTTCLRWSSKQRYRLFWTRMWRHSCELISNMNNL